MPVRKQAILLFCLLMFSYSYVHQHSGWNQNSRLDLLHAVFFQRTFKIDEYHKNTGDKSVHEGHFYSDKAPGIAFLAIPAFAASALVLDVLDIPMDSPRGWLASSWITTIGSVGLITALGGVALFLSLCRFVEQRVAFATALISFLGAAPFPYATMLFSHAAVIGLICVALWAIADDLKRLRNHSDGNEEGKSTRRSVSLARYVLAGLCCGLAVASEYTAVIAVSGVLLCGFLANPRRGLVMTAVILFPALLIPAYNWICFGSPTSFGYHHLALPEFQEMNRGLFGITFPPKLSAAYLLLLSPERGLFFWTPFFLLAFAGLKPLLGVSRRIAWMSSSVLILYVLFLSGYYMPSGGAALGPRHLAPMLPFLIILAAFGFQRFITWGLLLGYSSLLLTGLATVIEAMPSDKIANPLFSFYLPKFQRGEFTHSLAASLGFPHYAGAMLFVLVLVLIYFRCISKFFPGSIWANSDRVQRRAGEFWEQLPTSTRRIAVIIVAQKLLFAVLLVTSPNFLPAMLSSRQTVQERFVTWDSGHYLHLAAHGYSPGADHCAFYPLWPSCIRAGSLLTGGNMVLSGYLLSNLLSVVALIMFYRYVAEGHGAELASRATMLLLFFPGSIFFFFAYSESLFLFLLMACLTSLRRKNLRSVAVAAFFLPLTRAIGAFIFPVLVWELFRKRSPLKAYWICGASLLGYLSYFGIMYLYTGNAFEGFTAQRFFPAQPSLARIADPVGFVQSFANVQWAHDMLHSPLDRGLFLLFLITLFWAFRMDSGYYLYSLFCGLIPAMSNIFMSYTRFLSLVFPFFIVLARPNLRARSFWVVIGLCGAVQLLLFFRHIAGKWVG